jgi:mannose-6-phosphate isomerase-like protein (cupin superfamily)
MNNKDIMAWSTRRRPIARATPRWWPSRSSRSRPIGPSSNIARAFSPAAVHEKDAELMVVLEGTGDIVTGGKLVNEKRSNANNLSGSSISDGNTQAVVKGDMIIVPANTPHQVIPKGGAPIVLMYHARAVPAEGLATDELSADAHRCYVPSEVQQLRSRVVHTSAPSRAPAVPGRHKHRVSAVPVLQRTAG